MQEQEDKSKKWKEKELFFEVEITQEGLKNMSTQERRAPTPEVVREEVLPLKPLEDPHHCEVTMPREDKNKNGKRNPEIQITGKKEINLIKKKEKLEKLQEILEKTS
jgi:hypothetical protein